MASVHFVRIPDVTPSGRPSDRLAGPKSSPKRLQLVCGAEADRFRVQQLAGAATADGGTDRSEFVPLPLSGQWRHAYSQLSGRGRAVRDLNPFPGCRAPAQRLVFRALVSNLDMTPSLPPPVALGSQRCGTVEKYVLNFWGVLPFGAPVIRVGLRHRLGLRR